MNALPPQFEEMADLVWSMVNDRLDPDGALRLRQLLADGSDNRRTYLQLMDQFASLEWEKGGGEGSGVRDQGEQVASGQWLVASDPPSTIPPIIVDSSPTFHSPVGSFLFSHLAAAVILGIGLLIGLRMAHLVADG